MLRNDMFMHTKKQWYLLLELETNILYCMVCFFSPCFISFVLYIHIIKIKK